MKKIIYLVVVLLSMGACTKNILEETPKSIASETFYNTVAEVEAAVNAIYYPVGVSQLTNETNLVEVLADYDYGKGSLSYINDYVGYSPANVTNMGYLWQAYYLMIRDANLAIFYTPNGNRTSESQKNQYIAEAKFLRAFAYFHLVRLWGGVPLRTEKTMKDIDIARSSVDEVYNFIISDLLDAEINLPDDPRVVGTPSKMVAKTLLADVYLTIENWTDARDKAGEVIASGKYSLVSIKTTDDFINIYGPDLITSSEEIFYFKYTRDYGNSFLNFLHYPSDGYKPYGANYFAHYTRAGNIFYKNWDNNDLRKQNNFYLWDIALGNDTYLFKKWIDPMGYNQSPNDWPFYRYPEVLLIYAEADNRVNKGPTTSAVEYLNMVHRRAYGYDPMVPSPIDFKIGDYDEDSFFELVLQEKGYETFNEGKRWFDLIRIHKAAEVIKETYNIDMAASMLLWPIPVGETSYNKLIGPNNPGY